MEKFVAVNVFYNDKKEFNEFLGALVRQLDYWKELKKCARFEFDWNDENNEDMENRTNVYVGFSEPTDDIKVWYRLFSDVGSVCDAFTSDDFASDLHMVSTDGDTDWELSVENLDRYYPN